MTSSRHRARIVVMQSIFAHEAHDRDAEEILLYNIEQAGDLDSEANFAKKTLKGAMKHKDEILKKIKEFATDWPIENIAPVDRAILEIGTYEMLYSQDVPPIVAVNEAIEIAKSFGSDNAPKFVNGVLSAILKKYCTHRDHKTGKSVSTS